MARPANVPTRSIRATIAIWLDLDRPLGGSLSSEALSISSDKIQAIRERADIVRVIGAHVTLKKQGQRYLGLCPFHSEKTPSFSVSPTKNLYYCFGCHAGVPRYPDSGASPQADGSGFGWHAPVAMSAKANGALKPELQGGGN